MDNGEKKHSSTRIDESIEFCLDIKKFYELEEVNPLNFKGYAGRAGTASKDEAVLKKEEPAAETTALPDAEELLKEVQTKFYIRFAIYVVIAMIVARLLNTYIIQETIVNGSSMSPTLENSEKIILDKVSLKFAPLKRFDVVVFDYQGNNLYIKRIVGLPGERVQIKDGKVYINDSLLEGDPLAHTPMEYAGIAAQTVNLGSNEYFVLGDNRNNSFDSRYGNVGAVKYSKILGRAWIRLYPLSKFGVVK